MGTLIGLYKKSLALNHEVCVISVKASIKHHYLCAIYFYRKYVLSMLQYSYALYKCRFPSQSYKVKFFITYIYWGLFFTNPIRLLMLQHGYSLLSTTYDILNIRNGGVYFFTHHCEIHRPYRCYRDIYADCWSEIMPLAITWFVLRIHFFTAAVR